MPTTQSRMPKPITRGLGIFSRSNTTITSSRNITSGTMARMPRMISFHGVASCQGIAAALSATWAAAMIISGVYWEEM